MLSTLDIRIFFACLIHPQALEACEQERRLPPRLVRAIMAAKGVGGATALQDMLKVCKDLEADALEAATLAEQVRLRGKSDRRRVRSEAAPLFRSRWRMRIHGVQRSSSASLG